MNHPNIATLYGLEKSADTRFLVMELVEGETLAERIARGPISAPPHYAMDWKTMMAYITGTVDQELLSRNEYLVAENRILRNRIHAALRLTDGERRTAERGSNSGSEHSKR